MRFQGGIECESLAMPASGFIQVGDAKFHPATFLYGMKLHLRTRVTLAEMNAGKTLLTAMPGVKYRLCDVKVIAIGGNTAATAAATGLAIYGTRSGTSTALYTALLAALTENSVCQINTADTSVVAAGALWQPNDRATAITCRAVSAGAYDLITATHFDILLDFCLEN